MLNKNVAQKSAVKTVWTSFAMALAVAVLGGAAQFLTDTQVLTSILSAEPVLLVLVPLFAVVGQFVKDYIKHA